MTHRFAGLLRCSRKECSDITVYAGITSAEEYHFGNAADPYDEFDSVTEFSLHIRYVDPAPELFPIPKECPATVRAELEHAFALFWHDHSAATNKLRAALEALMNDLGVKRFRINYKTHKRVRIDLHRRIELIRSRYPETTDLLLAAKWIGNAGVHTSDLTADDVFDALDLMEHALDEIVSARTKNIKQMAKAINRRKGPRLKRKR